MPLGNAVIGQSGGPTAVINSSLVGLIKEAIKYKRNYHLGKNMLVSQIKLAGNFFNLW